jgi:hypothetical protein
MVVENVKARRSGRQRNCMSLELVSFAEVKPRCSYRMPVTIVSKPSVISPVALQRLRFIG